MSFISNDTPLSSNFASEIFYIRTLSDLCGVLILFSQQEMKHSNEKEVEANMTEMLLSQQYEQYIHYKESIESINLCVHDLKHQIEAIRQETDVGKKSMYLSQAEKDIVQFDATYDTGLQTLDILLTSKASTMSKNKILFSCIADGTALSFMQTMDICSLFGNALDNAIEGLLKIDDPSKRILNLIIERRSQSLFIMVENYYQHPLILSDGNYTTTKSNKALHGFGIKSIRRTVQKYDGTLTIDTKDNWFTLCALIPIPKDFPAQSE